MKRDSDVERLLEEYSRSMAFEGKERVRERLVAAEPGERRIPRARTVRRAALVLAALLALATATVFADDIVKVIRKVAFGAIEAEQVQDYLPSEDDRSGAKTASHVTIYPGSLPGEEPLSQADIDAIDEWEYTKVYNIDEVRELFDFVREPAWLPEDYVFEYAEFMRYPSGRIDQQSVTLYYGKPIWKHFFQVSVEQWPVGDDARIEMQTIETIEQTKVGDSDALMHVMGEGNDAKVELWWIRDGMGYYVFANSEDEARKVAESIP